MSYVKLERRPPTFWRARASSIGEMIDQGWTVFSVCCRSPDRDRGACYLVSLIDLAVMEFLLGEAAELWNLHPGCRRFGCGGQVTFFGAPPELGACIELRAGWPPDWSAERPPQPPRVALGSRRAPSDGLIPPLFGGCR